MELIAKSEDQQGSRYQFAGSFNLIEEDWMVARSRNKKSTAGNGLVNQFGRNNDENR